MRAMLISIICLMSLNACADKNAAIKIGYLSDFKPSDKTLDQKPKKEIARVCRSHSVFSSKGINIDDVLLEARKITGRSEFRDVGLWYESFIIGIFWEKRCLILGEI